MQANPQAVLRGIAWTLGTLWLLTLSGAPAIAGAQEGRPTIENFRFSPPRVRQGDTIQYSFTYKNFPGGLAAVKDVEMWVEWRRSGYRAIPSRFVPSRAELAGHTADSGTFESRTLTWRAPESAPADGVEVEYTLIIAPPKGKKVSVATMIRFEP